MTMPPQFLLAALAGAGLWAGLKWLTKSETKSQSESDQDTEFQDEKNIPRLIKDPDTGIYRPEDTTRH